MRAIMILPIFATPLAAGYLFFHHPVARRAGRSASSGFPFLSNPDWALASVIFVDVWQWTPFCFLVFLAALQSVPDELYEAAVVDGAGGWQLIRMVLLPALQNTIVIVLLLRLAEALKPLRHPLRADRRGGRGSRPSRTRSWPSGPVSASSTSATRARSATGCSSPS